MAFFTGFSIGVLITLFLVIVTWAFIVDRRQDKKIEAFLKKHLGAKKYLAYKDMLESPIKIMWRSLG